MWFIQDKGHFAPADLLFLLTKHQQVGHCEHVAVLTVAFWSIVPEHSLWARWASLGLQSNLTFISWHSDSPLLPIAGFPWIVYKLLPGCVQRSHITLTSLWGRGIITAGTAPACLDFIRGGEQVSKKYNVNMTLCFILTDVVKKEPPRHRSLLRRHLWHLSNAD